MQHLSKSQFKPQALKFMREVEETGESILITDHGKSVLELKPYKPDSVDPLVRLKGTVVEFTDPFEPVSTDDWESAN
ncbi:MAG: type II toxin-antitoxin system Phd/YefM family antitoxin [Flavobacteriales bacterium]|nr:type II toxin-antitoxin system Phd/YefM family antitoxin [Flavobacteriales bacterium]